MSDMELVIAVRFELKSIDKNNTIPELTKIFGKPPDDFEEYDGVVDYFHYNKKDNDGFEVNLIGSRLFADYIIADDGGYGTNVDITDEDISKIILLAKQKGLNYLNYKIKVLYFYNGGCAGLSEVK